MNGFVFLGPSMQRSRARKILPDAVFLAPVNGGDLLSVMKYEPSYLALIDGNFGTRPSVWHKEILYALACGTPVLGASSMGALRAAELHEYGMVGVGQVFEWYRDNHIVGDDEVALIHSPEDLGFEALSTSLVDLRFALNEGVTMGLLSKSAGDRMLTLVKERHFADRNWDCLLQVLDNEPHGGESPENVRSILRQISVKRLDAEKLLGLLSKGGAEAPRTAVKPIDLLTSSMLALIGRVISRPVLQSGDWLHASDLLGRNLRFHPAAYFLTSIVARTLSLPRSNTVPGGKMGATEVTTAALKMYVALQVEQAFPAADKLIHDSSSTTDEAFKRAARLLAVYLESTGASRSVSHSELAKRSMVASLGRLARVDSPNLRHLLGEYGLNLLDLSEAITLMLDLELFVLSYQIVPDHVPNLFVDWWGQAILFLDFEGLSLALGEISEKRTRVRMLMQTRPNSYHLIRFGFQRGEEELCSYG